MTISKYNAEGYYDPTAHEALSSIAREERKARFRPMVYICSPYSGDGRPGDVERNTENARRYSRFAVEQGYIPQTPHLYFPQFMNDDDPEERSLALFMDIALLSKCAELWVFGDRISNGMAQELRKAEARGMPIRRYTTECEEVL